MDKDDKKAIFDIFTQLEDEDRAELFEALSETYCLGGGEELGEEGCTCPEEEDEGGEDGASHGDGDLSDDEDDDG